MTDGKAMTAATVGEALRDLTRRFAVAGIPSARLDARLLVGHALGLDATAVFAHPERPLDQAEAAAVETLAARRERREPLSHIVGRREFWSLPFKVTAATLDPRPDSETLVEAVLERLPDRNRPYRLLDFGTGTGCLLLALLSELPGAQGLAVDRSPEALAVAEENARALGLHHRVRLRCGDWGTGIDGLFDVIVSNPPYIPDQDIAGLEAEVAAFEPWGALAGGADGLDCYRALAPEIGRLLASDGTAALEIGQGQAAAVTSLMRDAGLRSLGIRRDLAGIERCVLLTQPPEPSR